MRQLCETPFCTNHASSFVDGVFACDHHATVDAEVRR